MVSIYYRNAFSRKATKYINKIALWPPYHCGIYIIAVLT